MNVLQDLAPLKRKRKPVVAAAGFFDGVHLGHRKIIDIAVACARDLGGEAWVMTFDTHPLRVLNPGAAPPLLTSTRHKLRLLAKLNIDGCLVLPFNRELAALEPERFVSHLLGSAPSLAAFVVGRNWNFGRQGRGTPALLTRLCRGSGIEVRVIRPKVWRGETISSTRIRSSVLCGALDESGIMLGRPFSVLGTVTRGAGIGNTLGFPTANLDPHNEVTPPFGVYAARAVIITDHARRSHVESQPYKAIVNFGIRPTFAGADQRQPVFEVHIMDIERALYGREIEVHFVARIREERRFPTPGDLAAQIVKDVAAARSVLAQGDTRGAANVGLYKSRKGPANQS